MKSDMNEARGGVEGACEFLLWNLQVPVEPISHSEEPGLHAVGGGEPSEEF